MKKTYIASCHCGNVRVEANVDLSQGSGRCNCSICSRKRNWSVSVDPQDFRLLSDEAAAGDYQFGSMSAHHRFCKNCGIHVYGHGYIEEIGGEFRSLSIACIENITAEELAAIPVQYMDGRGDNWWNPPKVTAYL